MSASISQRNMGITAFFERSERYQKCPANGDRRSAAR
jgi:hypothetical protein